MNIILIFYIFVKIYSGTLQEPESSSWLVGDDDVSNEEENVPNLLLSFSTPLISMMKSENKKDMMHFSSSTAPANHSIDSTSTSSFGNTYINLDLAIWICQF